MQMEKQVSIVEYETGKVIATYPVDEAGQNYTPGDEEYFSHAWKCAVDDGIVDADDRAKYSFRLNE